LYNFAPFLKKIPGDPFGARRISNNVRQTFEFFRKEIKEHEISLDDNEVRDFIDAYLKEIKQQEAGENTDFSGRMGHQESSLEKAQNSEDLQTLHY
jgi:hypothetical protein